MKQLYQEYAEQLKDSIDQIDWQGVASLSAELRRAWVEGRRVFVCGNGGSAANAMHIANDLHYGIDPENGGLSVEALTANTAVLSCLANDVDFSEIFAHQLKVNAKAHDILICLSGSGNSPNIIKAIEMAKSMNVKTFGLLGFSGGKAKDMVDCAIHFEIDDMQISEDLQLVVGHMLMRDLAKTQISGLDSSATA